MLCESNVNDAEKQKNFLKYLLTRTSDYVHPFSKPDLTDYYFCKKMINTYEKTDLIYTNSLSHDSQPRR